MPAQTANGRETPKMRKQAVHMTPPVASIAIQASAMASGAFDVPKLASRTKTKSTLAFEGNAKYSAVKG
jgi:hypothetical protein